MEINVVQGNIVNSTADTLIVNLFEGVAAPGGAPGGATGALDAALEGAISELIAQGDLSGKAARRASSTRAARSRPNGCSSWGWARRRSSIWKGRGARRPRPLSRRAPSRPKA
jgi:hypothetical protein